MYGALEDCIGFAVLTIAPLISESLLGNTSVTMAIHQKYLGTFSSYTSTISLTLIFREFIFDFDVCCVSGKITTYSCLHLSQKLLLMRFILLVVLERTVIFVTTVDVVLEVYNNCLQNNCLLNMF